MASIVCETLGLPAGETLQGHRAWCSALRSEWLDGLLVEDQAAIPQGQASGRQPCWRKAHLGLCRTRDRWCWKELTPAVRALQHYIFQNCRVGDVFRVEVQRRHPVATRGEVFVCAHLRKARPEVVMLVRCRKDDQDRYTLCFEADARLEFQSVGAILKDLITDRKGGAPQVLLSVGVATLSAVWGSEHISMMPENDLVSVFDHDTASAGVVDKALAPGQSERLDSSMAHWRTILERGIAGLPHVSNMGPRRPGRRGWEDDMYGGEPSSDSQDDEEIAAHAGTERRGQQGSQQTPTRSRNSRREKQEAPPCEQQSLGVVRCVLSLCRCAPPQQVRQHHLLHRGRRRRRR